MYIRELVIICTLLFVCSADQSMTETNSMLDPNRITCWRTKWASAPILLSINNRSKASTATFFFSPTTSLTLGILEIAFPTGFNVGAGLGQTYLHQIVQMDGQTYIGGQDYTVTVTGIRNPMTAGAYGPFALRTRYCPMGQQVDVNLAFGSVYIYGDPGSLGSLSVSLIGTGGKNAINKSGNSLSFKFTIGVSLWKYDTFIISADARWTIAKGTTCKSADYPGFWNDFNGTNKANPHELDCIVTPQNSLSPVSQTIYIYGLAVDGIDVGTGPMYIDLRVSAVTTPNAVYPGNSYIWTVSTSRFGTTTMLETGSFSAGPILTTDVISTATWTPTWGLATSSIASGTSYFMDLSFSVTNLIPSGGSITIALTEYLDAIDPNWYSAAASNCYIVTYLNSYSPRCVTNGNLIKLTNLPTVAAGTNIKVRNVVTFTQGPGGSEAITSVQTFDSNNNLIDSSVANLASFSLALNSNSVSGFLINFVDSLTGATAGMNLAGNNGVNEGIEFNVIINPTPSFTGYTITNVYCPFTNDVEDFGINVPDASYGFSFVNSGTSLLGGVYSLPPIGSFVPVTSNVPILTTTPNYTSQGYINLTGSIGAASPSSPSFTQQLNLIMFRTLGASPMSLPRVVNNLATAYECRVMIHTYSTTVPTYSGASRFVISPQVWQSLVFSSPCSQYIDGIPAIFSLQPSVIGVPASANTGATYYVEVQIAGVANFGINSGFTTTIVSSQNGASSLSLDFTTGYPVASSQSGSVSAMTYTASIGSTVYNYVAITNLSMPQYVSTPSNTIVTFPIGGVSGSVSPIVRSYYILMADPRYKFITHEGTSPAFTYTSPVATTTGVTASITGTSQGTNGSTSFAFLTLALDGVIGGSSSDYYVYFLFGKGFTWADSRSVLDCTQTTPISFTNTYYFSSPTSSLGYSGVLVYAGSAVQGYSSSSTGASTVSLSGFTIPFGANTYDISIGIGSSVASTACVASVTGATIQYTSFPGAITYLSVTPAYISTQGPDGVNINHIVRFTLTNGVPAGGSITIVFNPVWDITTCSTCSVVSGLSTGNSIDLVRCYLSSNSAVVTGFEDFSSTPLAQITIAISGLLAPITPSGSTSTQFVTSLTSNVGSAFYTPVIDQASTNALLSTGITVTASSLPGVTVWLDTKTYPMSAGTVSADLYLKFALPHALASCGIITVSSPLPFKYVPGTVNNYCFLSPLRNTGCIASYNTLQITLGQDYAAGSILELYLDSAVDNPSSTSSTTAGFSILTTWGGITVDTDTTSTAVHFQASALLESSITTWEKTTSLSFSPTNTGEDATYIFTFQDSVRYTPGDQYWILFPAQFDYFLGYVWTWLTNEPNSYYIDCNSSQLGTTWCRVDHGVVVVQGSNVVLGNTEIAISISGVVNPAAGQTAQFQMYHLDKSGNYLTVNQSFGTVSITAFATNLEVRSLVQTDQRLFQSSDYTWRIYIQDTLSTDSELQVLFPKEFALNLFSQKDFYLCSSSWVDKSAGATITSPQNWNSAFSCARKWNLVTLPPPETRITFTNKNAVTFTIHSVSNTQWGQSRTLLNQDTDFDVQDRSLWPMIYPYWVSKFIFFVSQGAVSNFRYTSRSYLNTNAAYAGFYDGSNPLYVNSYVPQTKTNRVIVYAGTQTQDIWISTNSGNQPMSAKEVVLTPSTNIRTPDNGMLKYTSATDNWVFLQNSWKIRFRVAAAIDLSKGLYYIDWVNRETALPGMNKVQYDTPVSTLVEVIGATIGHYAFAVANISDVYTGYSSLPIPISVPNAPHSDVAVNISVSGATAGIYLTPTSVPFSLDVNVMYFQVQVASNYSFSLGYVQTLLFNVTGTDASVYTIPASQKFTIINKGCCLCTSNCLICADTEKCGVCNDGFFLTMLSTCEVCETCAEDFTATVTGPYENTYSITFNRIVSKTFSPTDFSLTTSPSSQISWQVSKNGNNLSLSVFNALWNTLDFIYIDFVSSVVDQFGNELTTKEFIVGPPSYDLSGTEILNRTVTITAETVALGAVVICTSMGSGMLGMNLLGQLQYFSYIGVVNYTVTGSAKDFYLSLNQKRHIPNFFNSEKDFAPGRRMSEDIVHPSDFLDNSGVFLSVLILIIIVHFLIYSLNRGLGQECKLLKRASVELRWNVYLYFWYFAHLDLLVSALLQIKDGDYHQVDVRAVFCFLLSFLTLISTVVTPVFLYWFIYTYTSQLIAEELTPCKQQCSALVSFLRTEVTYAKYIYPVYYTQRVVYSFLIVFLQGQQFYLVVGLIFPSLFSTSFVLAVRPMVTQTMRILQILTEFESLSVFALLCATTLLSTTPSIPFSWTIIALTLTCLFSSLAILVLGVIRTLKLYCKNRLRSAKVQPSTNSETIISTRMVDHETEISFGDFTMSKVRIAIGDKKIETDFALETIRSEAVAE